nr:hypothetical protein [Dictyobacter kobayashii]
MMKDRYPDPQNFRYPPCSLSARCIQYLDEIDTLYFRAAPARSVPCGDVWEGDQVEQLHAHLLSCRVCQIALATARTRRDQQRQAFQILLTEGEGSYLCALRPL